MRLLVPRSSQFLFMSLGEWTVATLLALLAVAVTYPLYNAISLWVGVGLGVFVLLFLNLAYASRFSVPFIHVVAITGMFQLVLAPWAAWYFPVHHPVYDIGARTPVYLDYAVPACLSLLAGLFLPLLFLSAKHTALFPAGTAVQRGTGLRNELELIFWAGLTLKVLGPHVPASVQFFTLLVENLSYFAAFAYIILGYQGGASRVALLLLLQLYDAINSTAFHQLILWSSFFVLILATKRGWGLKLLPMIVIGFLGVMVLQQAKIYYRDALKSTWSVGNTQRIDSIMASARELTAHPELLTTPYAISYAILRFDQGWIVNRVMVHVPEVEPFAHGETLVRGLKASLLPRFLAPNKFEAGGRENFERYTGHRLFNASMDLGYAGEMYANFGYGGGILGVGIYGLVLGLAYRWLCQSARRAPLWWAWGAYVAIVAVKAEDSIGFVANWLIKSVVIVIACSMLFPVLRRELFPPRGAQVGSEIPGGPA